MTTGIKNIDKFFKDLFRNYKVKPSDNSWDKIAEALDTTNPKDAIIPDVDEIGTLFKGYKVAPSERVWQNIFKVLERDKFTIKRMSKSAVSAIVAFFNNTTATVVTSVLITGGVALLLFNPFNNQQNPKISEQKTINSIEKLSTPPATLPQQSMQSKPSVQDEHNKQQTIVKDEQITQNTGINVFESKGNDAAQPANTLIKNNTITTGTIKTKSNSAEPIQTNIVTAEAQTLPGNVNSTNLSNHGKALTADEFKLTKYPSRKVNVAYNPVIREKASPSSVDVREKMDELIDRFYRQWSKKFNRNVDRFYAELYYQPMYGSTSFIAGQETHDSMTRSYNEYLSGNPSNSFGLNFGYIPNRIAVETGIIYQDRHSRRNENYRWFSNEITKDSIGFIFNTIDSTYKTIYRIDTVSNEYKKEYTTRMSYQTIEVPLLIGYRLVDKKNSLMIRTGLLTSYIFKISEEESNLDETARQHSTYPERNKVDFSWLLNVSYDYSITDYLKVSVTPTVRYNITGLYKGASISKPFTIGAGLGVKYVF